MSKFQLALLIIFGLFILGAVLTFAFYKGSSSTSATVTVWGSIPATEFDALLANPLFSGQNPAIHYVEKSASSLQADFTEALAQGNGPDLIVLTQDEVWKAHAKLAPIPYASISQETFSNTFTQAGEIFELPQGIEALPLIADPLVLYYNRDLLSAAGLAKPLTYWDEIYDQAAKLTKKDAAGNIIQSAIALGETKNIPNFKETLSLLLLQAGSDITSYNEQSVELRSSLSDNPGLPVSPAESALDFYTQFANPSKAFYSWNRIMPDAQTAFASGDLAYYLGLASELPAIRKKSPTLNFAVAAVPQSRVSGKTVTSGRVYAVALSRGTKDATAALTAATKLVSAASAAAFADIIDLPPARRDLLVTKPTDAFGPVFYDAALQERSWLDPDAEETQAAFSDAIESVTSGRARVSEAVGTLNDKLNALAGH